MRQALLLVDLQNDFLRNVRMAEVVARACDEAERARAAGWEVIHVWTTVRADGTDCMPHWRGRRRLICVEGSDGHASPLEVLPGDLVVHKRFFSAFAGTGLERLLRERGVEGLRVAGVQMQSCVRATVIDGYQCGFAVELAVDAVGSDAPLHAALSRDYLAARAAVSLPEDAESPGVEGVVAAAHGAQTEWEAMPWSERVAVLEEFAGRIVEAGLIPRIQSAVFKPRELARAEMRYARELMEAAVGGSPLAEVHGKGGSRWRRRAHGVVGVITPWNNPAAIALGKIFPALLHGNSVVWKPSPLDGGVADFIASLWDSGGVLQVVPGGAAVARQVMADARVNAVSLTGSDAAGESAMAVCGGRRIPLQAELGGNNAAVVWKAHDLAGALREVVRGAFSFAGQRCTANRRLIVPRVLVSRVLELVGALLGPMSPVISARSRERIEGQLKRGPAVALRGPAGDGWHDVPAAVVVAEDAACELVQEETFGPVLVVQPAEDFEHALDLCNGVRQGLAAAVFTAEEDLRGRFLERAQAGILKVNRSTVDAEAEAPFGGWKSSGVGPPEHGVFDREFFTRVQAVYE